MVLRRKLRSDEDFQMRLKQLTEEMEVDLA